jgi:hypothetical protein
MSLHFTPIQDSAVARAVLLILTTEEEISSIFADFVFKLIAFSAIVIFSF